jgi:O-succinylbenzoate synthase
MRQATIYEYRLPMDSGVILRDRHLTHRIGWILSLEDDGQHGLGEVAPLLGFSQETHEEAGMQLRVIVSQWVSHHSIDDTKLFPSVACGFSFALAELNGELPTAAQCKTTPLCFGDPDDLVARLANQSAPLAKMKVGLYEPIRDGMITTVFLEAVPNLSLRLDANRQWTLPKALMFADYVPSVLRAKISFIEEPCQTPEQSLAFAKETGINIAWDETTREDDFTIVPQSGVVGMVIKPMLIGSLSRCLEMIKQAHAIGWQVVISSSLESSLGLHQLARLANWQTPKALPGLDTLSLFQMQLHTPWPECALPIQTLNDLPIVWDSNHV